MIDNLFFLAATENKIYKYNLLYTKETKLIFRAFGESNDNSNITCVKVFWEKFFGKSKINHGNRKKRN